MVVRGPFSFQSSRRHVEHAHLTRSVAGRQNTIVGSHFDETPLCRLFTFVVVVVVVVGRSGCRHFEHRGTFARVDIESPALTIFGPHKHQRFPLVGMEIHGGDAFAGQASSCFVRRFTTGRVPTDGLTLLVESKDVTAGRTLALAVVVLYDGALVDVVSGAT